MFPFVFPLVWAVKLKLCVQQKKICKTNLRFFPFFFFLFFSFFLLVLCVLFVVVCVLSSLLIPVLLVDGCMGPRGSLGHTEYSAQLLSASTLRRWRWAGAVAKGSIFAHAPKKVLCCKKYCKTFLLIIFFNETIQPVYCLLCILCIIL